jgi:hypothetical protein
LVIRISRIAKSLIKNSNKTQGREGKQDSAWVITLHLWVFKNRKLMRS